MDKKPPSQALYDSPAGLRFLTEALEGGPSQETLKAFRKTAAELKTRIDPLPTDREAKASDQCSRNPPEQRPRRRCDDGQQLSFDYGLDRAKLAQPERLPNCTGSEWRSRDRASECVESPLRNASPLLVKALDQEGGFVGDKKVSDETRMRALFRTPAGQDWMRKALMGQVGEHDSEALQRERRRIQAAQVVPESDQSANESTPLDGTSSKSQET